MGDRIKCLAKATGFTFRLEQGNNIILTDGSNNVANDGTLALQELSTDLGNTTAGSSAAEAFDDTSVLNLLLHKC